MMLLMLLKVQFKGAEQVEHSMEQLARFRT